MAARPELKSTPREVLAQQIREYNLLYKPTYMYPLGSFWGGQNQDVATWLYIHGKIKKPLTRPDYEAVFHADPMAKLYARLGWKVPRLPPFIPEGWTLKPRAICLPDYEIYPVMKGPQTWPD